MDNISSSQEKMLPYKIAQYFINCFNDYFSKKKILYHIGISARHRSMDKIRQQTSNSNNHVFSIK